MPVKGGTQIHTKESNQQRRETLRAYNATLSREERQTKYGRSPSEEARRKGRKTRMNWSSDQRSTWLRRQRDAKVKSILRGTYRANYKYYPTQTLRGGTASSSLYRKLNLRKFLMKILT